ncbi:MAG: tetratricopeptide repeat protein [Candidatus Geothermincolia bacterium]
MVTGAGSQAVEASGRRVGSGSKAALAGLLLACCTIALFAPAVGFEFVAFDDPAYVSENSHVARGLTLASLRWAFVATEAANWHPLTWISHLTDVTLFGLDPAGHHLTSILLHAASTTLLFFVLRGLTGSLLPSLFAAALFAAHPLRVESVVWVSERKDVLSVFFGVLTLGLYSVNARRPSGKLRGLTLLCYGAGLLSKPLLVTLPPALLLLDYWPLGRFNGRNPRRAFTAAVKEKLPLLALSVIASAATWVAQSSRGAISPTPLLTRLADVPAAGMAYLAKTLAPFNLSCFYPVHETPLPWWALAGSCATLGSITLLAIRGRSRRPHLLVGWLWFLGTLVPMLGFIRIGGHFIADRYTYLPHIGLFAALAWEGRDLAARSGARKPAAVAGVTLLTVLTLLTRAQTAVWKDGVTLFEHADAVTPDNWDIKSYLGRMYLESGRNADAARVFAELVRIRPGLAEAHGNLGLALVRIGRFAAAAAAEEQALRLQPDLPEAANVLGYALSGLGRWEQAAAAYTRALALRPDDPEAHLNLARALGLAKRHREAVEHLLAAIDLNPDLGAAHVNLGAEYLALGKHAEALAAARKAVALEPDREIAHFQLGLICAATGDADCARREHETLLGMNAKLAARLREKMASPPPPARPL